MKPAPSVALSLRRAVSSDRALLFEWANDPITRANSFTPDPIDWPSHCSWFEQALRDQNRLFYVVLAAANDPIGQARFERCGEREAEISISLAGACRGRGLAASAIRLATDRAVKDGGFEVIYALVRPANEASRRAFARAGYIEHGLIEHRGCAALRFAYGVLRPRRPDTDE